MIVVDPELSYSSDLLVVARLDDSKEATFKQLVIDDEQKYLKPLDSQYSAAAINDNGTIIGVAR